MKYHSIVSRFLFSATLFSAIAVQAADRPQETPAPLHEESYTVDSLYYLPPPPEEGDAAFENDKAAYRNGFKMKGSERWKQAAADADLHQANQAKVWSEALGVNISEATTPETWKMLGELLVVGADYASNRAKQHYMRTRPFVVFNNPTCQPADEPALRKNGSYPSGHTAFGTVTALVFSQAKPERAKELMKKGYEFGQSRVICGAHWQSDVNAGRYVGATEYARLETVPEFHQQMERVKAELHQ